MQISVKDMFGNTRSIDVTNGEPWANIYEKLASVMALHASEINIFSAGQIAPRDGYYRYDKYNEGYHVIHRLKEDSVPTVPPEQTRLVWVVNNFAKDSVSTARISGSPFAGGLQGFDAFVDADAPNAFNNIQRFFEWRTQKNVRDGNDRAAVIFLAAMTERDYRTAQKGTGDQFGCRSMLSRYEGQDLKFYPVCAYNGDPIANDVNRIVRNAHRYTEAGCFNKASFDLYWYVANSKVDPSITNPQQRMIQVFETLNIVLLGSACSSVVFAVELATAMDRIRNRVINVEDFHRLPEGSIERFFCEKLCALKQQLPAHAYEAIFAAVLRQFGNTIHDLARRVGEVRKLDLRSTTENIDINHTADFADLRADFRRYFAEHAQGMLMMLGNISVDAFWNSLGMERQIVLLRNFERKLTAQAGPAQPVQQMHQPQAAPVLPVHHVQQPQATPAQPAHHMHQPHIAPAHHAHQPPAQAAPHAHAAMFQPAPQPAAEQLRREDLPYAQLDEPFKQFLKENGMKDRWDGIRPGSMGREMYVQEFNKMQARLRPQ